MVQRLKLTNEIGLHIVTYLFHLGSVRRAYFASVLLAYHSGRAV